MQKSVIEYLQQTVSRFPDKFAVKDSEMSITFGELWQNAQKISSTLINANIGLNNPIGVYIPKGCKMIESFAGINMSGNFYVPLDTKSPDSRVNSIITTLESKVLITDRAHLEALKAFANAEILVVEDIVESDINTEDAFVQLDKQIDTDPVYSIFTSGSTGAPKGVVVSHRGVIDYIDWANDTFHFESDAVIGNQAPFYFDNSTLDIYLMYSTGATLNIIPESCFAFPAKLVDFLNEEKISFVFWVPFVLVNVANLNIFETKKPEYLKDVFFAGEVMPNKHLNYWRRHLPNCRYANLYGPTEITVDCTYYEVTREFTDSEPLPIGFPCCNSDVLILVDRKRMAKKGEQGELCVRGSSLALGYYNNPEKTASAFIQNPLHSHYPETIYCTGDVVYENEYGEIMYVGRIDSQIKHNGYRIELGEIETAILGSHMVDNCCVVYDFANKKIVMFYQAAEELNMAAFRKAISTAIPRYMLPSKYHREEILQQNGSGKIDRAHYNKLINKWQTMKAVNSFDEVMTYISKVRGLRKGFLTNFFPEQKKIDIWISHKCLYVVESEETVIFLKKDDGFTYILYCATNKEQLFDSLASLPEDAYVFDQIVDVRTDISLLDGFKSLGFVIRKSLVRMSKINETPEEIAVTSVYDATKEDIPALDELLHKHFDKYAEQLPTLDELNEFIDSRRVIVKRADDKIAGFIFYDLSPSTLYLRYWLVNPEFRNHGVGSELFHEYNRRGVACKRHMLWVVEDNENAIKRYEHYGYKNEIMKDYVLTKNVEGLAGGVKS